MGGKLTVIQARGIVPDPKSPDVAVRRLLVPIAVDLLRKFELRSTEADNRATLWRWAHAYWSEWLKAVLAEGVDAYVSEQPGCSNVSLSALRLQLAEQSPVSLLSHAAKSQALKKEHVDDTEFNKQATAWRLTVTANGSDAPPAVVAEVILRSIGRALYASCTDPAKAEQYLAAALEVCKELGGAKEQAQEVVRDWAPDLALLAADHPNGLPEATFWTAFGNALNQSLLGRANGLKRPRKEASDLSDPETDNEAVSDVAQKPDTDLIGTCMVHSFRVTYSLV